jgi:APA family basic amino acid/polyamine antiporter
MMGLGMMIGAGVFIGMGNAIGIAGPGLLYLTGTPCPEHSSRGSNPGY